MSAQQFGEINEALSLLNAAYSLVVLAGVQTERRWKIMDAINRAEMLIKEEIQ